MQAMSVTVREAGFGLLRGFGLTTIDRKRVVEGKGGDLGGRRIIKKKKNSSSQFTSGVTSINKKLRKMTLVRATAEPLSDWMVDEDEDDVNDVGGIIAWIDERNDVRC